MHHVVASLELYRKLFPDIFERYDYFLHHGYNLHEMAYESSLKKGTYKLKLELLNEKVNEVVHISQFKNRTIVEPVREFPKKFKPTAEGE